MFEVVNITSKNYPQTIYIVKKTVYAVKTDENGETYFLFYDDSATVNPWKWEPAILYRLYKDEDKVSNIFKGKNQCSNSN